MANLNDTITDGTAKFKVVKTATTSDVFESSKETNLYGNLKQFSIHASSDFSEHPWFKIASGQSQIEHERLTIKLLLGQTNASTHIHAIWSISLASGTKSRGLIAGSSYLFEAYNVSNQNFVVTFKPISTGGFEYKLYIKLDGTIYNGYSYVVLQDAKRHYNYGTQNKTTFYNVTSSDDGVPFESLTNDDFTIMYTSNKLISTNQSAASHNALYRGNDLTEYFNSGRMSIDIANGNFDNIYIGDYIVKTVNLPAITYTNKAGTEKTQEAQTFSNVKWLVGAIDPHLYCGNTGNGTTVHHVLLIPISSLQCNVSMNPTATTEGGYLGSDMWRVHMPNWANAIKTAFGEDHVLKHREILTNAVNDTAASIAGANQVGAATGIAWTDVEVNIPNESMIYSHHSGSSCHEGGDFPRMLPLYALKCSHLNDRTWFWTRTVASISAFSFGSNYGRAVAYSAHTSNSSGGIRPYFLLY